MGRDRGTPEPIADPSLRYFSFLAQWGITKHLGSHNATRQLVELCHIAQGQYVLDVGCGVGATPSYLAKSLGCRVVGVDITPKMIQRAQARVESEGVADMVELRVADARALPFEDDHFDAVICESVVVFVANKQCAMDEYVRVTKPCGYVGLVEATLLKPTDDTELLSYMAGVAGTQGDMPSREEWAQYLHRAGLQDVTARAYQLDIRQEAKARLQRYRARDMLAALARLPRMWFGDPAAKAFLKETFGGVKYVTKVTFDYLGYGVYVGRK